MAPSSAFVLHAMLGFHTHVLPSRAYQAENTPHVEVMGPENRTLGTAEYFRDDRTEGDDMAKSDSTVRIKPNTWRYCMFWLYAEGLGATVKCLAKIFCHGLSLHSKDTRHTVTNLFFSEVRRTWRCPRRRNLP
ncbi:hypothetical protein B0J12DRAFT_697047 [Macrophomina phaseolina]|uniref:Secreted protein n=1 Tax=Macrophomina phaseolina TaxID=35725 RepID=A0ABQ8GIR2_9PEZI|nr:hypothetical protein B0J12DRAFT_697047 [Macrophomina phaseolina]